MPGLPASKAIAPRPGGPEPLRRKRVQPAPAASPGRRRWLQYVLVFVTVVLIVDALAGDNGLMERLRARRVYNAEAAALEALRLDNQRMLHDIRRLRDDPSAIEELAREELGLIKPGEVLFIIREARPARH